MMMQIGPVPRHTAAEAALRRIRWAPPADGSGFPWRRAASLRLMIVEDEAFIAFDAQQILQGAGHKVVAVALTAEAAIEKAGELLPDMILMDIRLLSRRDGVDAAIAIRARYGIRCVFASAYADDEASARAQAAEPLGFVSKPFTRASLIEAVERCAGLL